MSTHDRTNNQSTIGGHGPAENNPDTLADIKEILGATTGDGIWNGRQQSGDGTGNHNPGQMGNETDNHTADRAQRGTDDV